MCVGAFGLDFKTAVCVFEAFRRLIFFTFKKPSHCRLCALCNVCVFVCFFFLAQAHECWVLQTRWVFALVMSNISHLAFFTLIFPVFFVLHTLFSSHPCNFNIISWCLHQPYLLHRNMLQFHTNLQNPLKFSWTTSSLSLYSCELGSRTRVEKASSFFLVSKHFTLFSQLWGHAVCARPTNCPKGKSKMKT